MRAAFVLVLVFVTAANAAPVVSRNDTYDLKTLEANHGSMMNVELALRLDFVHAICTPMRSDLVLALREKRDSDIQRLHANFEQDFQPTADKLDLCLQPHEDEEKRSQRMLSKWLRFDAPLFEGMMRMIQELSNEQARHRQILQTQLEVLRLYAVRNLSLTRPPPANQTNAFSISQLKTAQLMEENSRINWPLFIVFTFVLALIAVGIAITLDGKRSLFKGDEQDSLWHSSLSFNKLQSVEIAPAG